MTEGLIKEPPNVYKKFENALLTFAFSHMILEVEEEGIYIVITTQQADEKEGQGAQDRRYQAEKMPHVKAIG